MTRRRIVLPSAVLAAACALTLWPGPGQAASRTQTLRFFDKPVSIKLTHADGIVVARPESAQPQPGDVLDVNSLLYRGNHAHHAKRWTASSHLRCVFGTGEPTCESHVAIGGSMLIFTGNPGTLTNGTGIYQGATGRVISAKQVNDNATDIVAKIHLRARAGSDLALAAPAAPAQPADLRSQMQTSSLAGTHSKTPSD
jgi:hypothetical protein